MLPASVKWLLGLMLVVLTAQASAMSTEDPDPELRAALKAAVSSSDSIAQSESVEGTFNLND